MPINLITDPWLPVRRLRGERVWIRPADIISEFADNPILALDFPRPDWNAAVTELLIGLLACVMAPEDDSEWAVVWNSPPTPEQLAGRFAPLAFAFNLGGDGPRCFQDCDSLDGCEEKPISVLLIDAPGAIALTKNVDLFVKRAEELALPPAHAAAALITMQTYAPAGGQGNRTSMRGGGPLTTLPVPRRKFANNEFATLWDIIWASVPCHDDEIAMPQGGALAKVFPWLAPARTSENDRPTLPEHGHPLQCYFATPRRIRLTFSEADGQSSPVSAEGTVLVRSFRQKNYGVKYDGWHHPHSPYYTDKKAGKLPYHPQPGGATYRDWLTWLVNPEDKTTETAATIQVWGGRVKRLCYTGKNGDVWQSGVLACGFDMDNMKARGWLEARIPYFNTPPDVDAVRWQALFFGTAKQLVASAQEAGSTLRYRARLAKFGSCDREKGSYSLPKNSPGKNAFDDLHETFWRETEPDFRAALRELRNAPGDENMKIREDFLHALRAKALQLFDEAAGTDDLADQDARRIVEARSGLGFAFSDTGDVRKTLGIFTAEAQQKVAKRKAKKKEAAA